MINTANIVFLFSSPRSGSTVLRLTLNKIEGLVALPETHFWVFKQAFGVCDFNDQEKKKKLISAWINYHTVRKMKLEDKDFLNEIHSVLTWKDLFELTVKIYLNKIGADQSKVKVICEKSPPHIFYQEEIKKMYPQAGAVYLVRDPRDVIASLKNCSWSSSNIYVNSRVWCNGVRSMNSFERNVLIKYEHLVLSPLETLNKIAGFLNLKTIGLASHNIEATGDEIESTTYSSKNSLNPITKEFIGSYKDKLSAPDSDIAIIQKVCRKEMALHGYEMESVKMNTRSRHKLFLYKLDLLLTKIGI
jgi:Sulfotransferase family